MLVILSEANDPLIEANAERTGSFVARFASLLRMTT
jgi:hypothetical protein